MLLVLNHVVKIQVDTRFNENPRIIQEESKFVQVSRSWEGPIPKCCIPRIFYRWDRTWLDFGIWARMSQILYCLFLMFLDVHYLHYLHVTDCYRLLQIVTDCYSATRRNLELNFLHEKPFTSTMRSLGRSALQAAQAVLQIKIDQVPLFFRNNSSLHFFTMSHHLKHPETSWNILKLLESKIKSSLNILEYFRCNFRPVPVAQLCSAASASDLSLDVVWIPGGSLPCQDVPRSTSGSGRQWWHPLPKFGRPVDTDDSVHCRRFVWLSTLSKCAKHVHHSGSKLQ